MAELTEQKELMIREFVTSKAATADNVTYGIKEPVYFTGKEDFASQIGELKPEDSDQVNAAKIKDLLCDFVMVGYGRFEDTKVGCNDAPVVKLIYDIIVYQEFHLGLEHRTLAHNRHVATVLQIRNKFLKSQTIQNNPKIRHSAVVQSGRTARNRVLENLPGVKGFYTILETTVEVF